MCMTCPGSTDAVKPVARKRVASLIAHDSNASLNSKGRTPMKTLHTKAGRKKLAMQHISALFVVALLLLCSGCNGKNNAAASTEASSDAPSEKPLGKATFSAMVDGVAVAGGAIDGLQMNNTAHIVPGENGAAPTLRIWLFDTKTPDDQDFSHSMRIEVPNQVGPNPQTHMAANIILSKDHAAKYYSKDASVTITSLTASRVTGTFSGKFVVSPDTPNVPKSSITITDGKFDLPIATMKVYPG